MTLRQSVRKICSNGALTLFRHRTGNQQSLEETLLLKVSEPDTKIAEFFGRQAFPVFVTYQAVLGRHQNSRRIKGKQSFALRVRCLELIRCRTLGKLPFGRLQQFGRCQ